jgi:hypothetical protein
MPVENSTVLDVTMPEEIERTEVSPQRVGDHHHVDPEQSRMRQPRQFHDQEEHQQPDDEVFSGVGALTPDRDLLELAQKIEESVQADADIDGDDDVVYARRQPFVEIVLLVHEQDLHDQGDRQQARYQLLRSTEAGVKIPDQPDELDQREGEQQIAERDVALERVAGHGSFTLTKRARTRVVRARSSPY